jgi:hypothetical protein
MRADGTGKHRVVQGLKVGRPPGHLTGRTLAFIGRAANDGVYVYQISSDAVNAIATRLRRYDQDQGAYVDVLPQNGPIAWSPSGRYLVYEGGECTGIFDNCLTVLDLQTGAERTDFAYGGGGSYSGRAYSPDWLPNASGYLVSERRCVDEACRISAAVGPGEWLLDPEWVQRRLLAQWYPRYLYEGHREHALCLHRHRDRRQRAAPDSGAGSRLAATAIARRLKRSVRPTSPTATCGL